MGTRAAQESEGRVGNAAVNRRPQTAGRGPLGAYGLRRTAAVVVVLALTAVLGGCEFFTASAFPEYVSSIQAERSCPSGYDAEDTEVYHDGSGRHRRSRPVLLVDRGAVSASCFSSSELDIVGTTLKPS